LSPALSPTEIETEKKILKKRWELISNGANKKDIRIRNLKLFFKDEQVSTD